MPSSRLTPANGAECTVCATPIPASTGPGRPSRYCSASCRQRAYRARHSGAEAAAQSSATPFHEREVPHLTEGELLAWRGMLELQSRALPLLDGELRVRTGLTINEFDVLYQLWIAPGQRRRMRDLAHVVVVTPSGITRLVDRLARRGLVGRVADEGRQAVEALLTSRGERLLRRAMDVHFAGVRALFAARLSAEEIDQLASVWARLRNSPVSPDPKR